MARQHLNPLLIGLVTLIGISCSSWAQDAPVRSFEQIADDVYWVGNSTHHTVLLVTDEGIILSDPLNREFSTWLKRELDERFGVPVRYVLYSHHHWDHASGGAVFEDTAQFVGHENMLAHLALPSADTPLPAGADGQDRNGNGQIERAEASGAFQENFELYDFDGDGALSGAEVTRGALNDVRTPDITYADRLTVKLGGKRAEMVYTGVHSHTDDMSIVVFPEASVGFMVDFISIVRPPRYIRGDQPIETWFAAIRVVEAQGFEIAAGGHGTYASSSYVTLFREYLEELRDQVAAGIAAGRTVEELQESIYMEAYEDWISYAEFRASNIAGMYNMLTKEF